jgi:putative RNA 2'-phosphotransferase
MPEEVRRCDAHDFFEGAQCPTCGAAGRTVLGGSHRRQLSKFVSGALRHFPDDAGIELDDAGWTGLSSLAAAVERKYDWADRETVLGVIATDPKGRFERRPTGECDRIRAAYGHSVDVTIEDGDGPVPATLYHGTAPRNVDPILSEGLRPMNRQQVHLSESIPEAREVGRRHADSPVVLEVDAAAMARDGYEVAKRGEATYTTDRVPPDYLSKRAE